MELSRRDFLRAAGVTSVAGVVFVACRIPERELIKQSPRDIPEDMVLALDDWYATACPVCGTGHGVIVRVVEGRARKIEGNPDHPTNRGKLMASCLAGVQALYHPDRLAGPMQARGARGSGSFDRVNNWDEAANGLVERIKAADPAKSVVITEPLRGHLGQVVRDFSQATGIRHMSLEPLEQSVLRAAVRDVFGQPRIPHFDIANAATVLSIGADFLESWVSPVSYSRAYGEFRQGAGRTRGKLIHASTRFSETAAAGDTWIPVAPGQEGTLALSIAYVLASEGLADAAGLARALPGGAASLAAFAPETAAAEIGATPEAVTAEKIREIAKELAEHKPALVIAGGSAAAQSNGLANVKAGLLLNHLLGSVGVKGGVLFNPAPPLQELEGLGTTATYDEWKGLRDRLQQGDIDLVLVHGANPAYSLANLKFGEALGKAKAVVSFSNIIDETAALADLVLPDRHPFESWGTDVPDPAPGYPVVTLQQPVVKPVVDEDGNLLYDSRAFGDLLLAAATALEKGNLMPAATMEALVRARMQALYDTNPNAGSVQGATFDAFWVGVLQRGGWWNNKTTGPDASGAAQAPARVAAAFVGPTGGGTYNLIPFVSGAMQDGSTAHLPWAQSTPDPMTSVTWSTWVEINSKEAARLGLREGDVVRLEGPEGTADIVAPVYLHPGIPPTIVCVPLGQGHTASGRYAENRGQNVFGVLGDATVDGAGALAWGATRVRLTRTGRRVRVPKLEGGMPSIQTEDIPIIEVTKA